MAAFHGKRGTGTFTGLSFEFISFTISATCDVAEGTIMDVSAVAAATHWKDYLPGFKDWTATVEALEPAAGIGIAALGTEAILTLDTTDGLSYSGMAINTGISPVNDTNDIGKCSLTFQGTAQLSAA